MQKSKRHSRFSQFLDTFPPSVRECLQTIPQTGGMLAAKHCIAVMETLNISAEDLMLRLLPAGKLYSTAEISNFQVGIEGEASIEYESLCARCYFKYKKEYEDLKEKRLPKV